MEEAERTTFCGIEVPAEERTPLVDRLPDGTFQTAPLPAHVQGHFGPGLRGHVLYQHHQNLVTQPLIREELVDLGIDISTGQIDRLLTEGHDQFHEEKDALLPAAREVSSYFQADDTGTRHLGKNAYTTVCTF